MPEDPAGDELDPTQPTYFSEPTEDVVETFAGEDPDGEDRVWDLDQGFVDSTGTVRLYTDENAAPVRVTLARYWREQIKQVPLEQMFAEVFTLAALLLGRASARVAKELPIEHPEPLTPELLDRVEQRMGEMAARLAELEDADEGYSMVKGENAVGVAADGRVQLTLSIFGLPQSIGFDQKWLEEATMAEVTGAVVAAYKEARGNFTEPVFTPGERETLAVEYQTLAARIMQAVALGMPGAEENVQAELAGLSTRNQTETNPPRRS